MSAEAQELLSLAVEAENCGNIQTAFETYQCALNLLFEDAKKETDENKKGSLHRIIGKYMDIAESLKKQLDANKTLKTVVSTTNAINTTSSNALSSTASSSATTTVFNATNSLPTTSAPRPSSLSRPSSSGNVTSNTTTSNTITNTKSNSTGNNANKQPVPQQPKPDYFDYTLGDRVVKPKQPPILSSMSSSTSTPNKRMSTAASSSSSSTGNTAAPTPNKPAIPAAARGNSNRTSTTGSTVSNTDATNRQKLKNSSGGQSDKDTNKLSEYESQIQNDMLDKSPGVTWDDIAGLAFAKQTLQEAVILPNLRPDLFTGLRAPPRGVLLFGPPGTGKTLLAKAVATESGFAFFSITASSVTSKYLGEGEKLMKGLFSVARRLEPAVIFLDEIDSLMSARKENEHEASRRVKTEFMTQVDGATTGHEERLLIMGATNIPWELDEAVLRRLVKRIYVPLPDNDARRALIKHQIMKHYTLSQKQQASNISANDTDSIANAKTSSSFVNLIFGDTRAPTNNSSSSSVLTSPNRSNEIAVPGFTEADLTRIVALTVNYSGSDLTAVCHEAAMGPIRELGFAALKTVKAEDVRSLQVKDFETAVLNIRPSVSPDSLQAYTKWGDQFGVTK